MKKILLALIILPPQAVHAEPTDCRKAIALYQPKGGVIPSEAIAKDIANTYLSKVYGPQNIRQQFPLIAKLQDGVWTVEGSLPRGIDGGVAIIRLCRRNGTVLSIIHEK